MYYTDNPVNDWNNYCAEQERRLQQYPICEMCNKRITDEHLIDINGDIFHEECFMENHRKHTEDYLE